MESNSKNSEKDCKKPCACPDAHQPLNSTIISLIKSTRQKVQADQKDYAPVENDFWTLRLESPFPHYWSFGYNQITPIINLTTPTDAKILYTAGRFLILYDYEYETIVSLEGHKNTVRCLSVDSSGRFAASCDEDHSNKIILWDLYQRTPIDVLSDFGTVSSTRHVWLSPCGRYLVACHMVKKQQKLLFYSWASDDKDRKITIELDELLDVVKSITFSSDNPEYFALTTSRRILFLTYTPGSKMKPPGISIHNGEYIQDSTVGYFIASTYMSGTHLCYSATETGHVRVWSDLDYYDDMCKEQEISNKKDEITYSLITSALITAFTTVDKYLVVANDMGRIQFFTCTLILLYCFEHKDLKSILYLSFDVRGKNDVEKSEIVNKDCRRANTLFILGKLCRKRRRDVKEWENKVDPRFVLPRNVEDEPEPFIVRNCLVGCKNEKTAYINFSSKSIGYLLENFTLRIVAIECHPARDYLVLATDQGALNLVDFVSNQEIVKKTVLPLSITSDGSFDSQGTVRCMKYSFDGYSLACGLSNGHIVFLSPLLLESKFVVQYTHRPIRILRFSPDGLLLAACDTTRIYFIKITPGGPELLAAQKTHGRLITDILFFTKLSGETICFSIGKDKNLVQYDIQKISSQKEVVIKKCVRIEQRSDPLCLSLAPDPRNIILGKSDFKLQLIDVDELVYTSNKHAPVLKDPINNLCMLNTTDESEYLFFTARNLIGLVKLPLDHNPYKWMSIPVSENKVSNYVFSRDRNFLFTLSRGDGEGLVNMWKVMPGLLEVLSSNVGNEEAVKFEHLLGPDRDYYLKEIKDYYAYASLLHQGTWVYSTVNPSIPVCEVPDILRALGCFFTNYEMECVIRKGEPRDKFKVEDRKMEFDELVELFASGKEFSKVLLDDIEKAFYRMCSMVDGSNRKEFRKAILRNDFIRILSTKGETMQLREALHFLRTLVDPLNKEKAKLEMEKQKLTDQNEENQSVDFVFLPEVITLDYFVTNILGMSKKACDMKVVWKKRKEQLKAEEIANETLEEKRQIAELAYRGEYIKSGLRRGKKLMNKNPCSKFNTVDK